MLKTGEQYLLFLRLLLKFQTFQADASSSAWAINSGRIRSVGGLSASDADLVVQGLDVTTAIDWVRGRVMSVTANRGPSVFAANHGSDMLADCDPRDRGERSTWNSGTVGVLLNDLNFVNIAGAPASSRV